MNAFGRKEHLCNLKEGKLNKEKYRRQWSPVFPLFSTIGELQIV